MTTFTFVYSSIVTFQTALYIKGGDGSVRQKLWFHTSLKIVLIVCLHNV